MQCFLARFAPTDSYLIVGKPAPLQCPQQRGEGCILHQVGLASSECCGTRSDKLAWLEPTFGIPMVRCTRVCRAVWCTPCGTCQVFSRPHICLPVGERFGPSSQDSI